MKYRFYYSAVQDALNEAECRTSYVWDGKNWVRYTEMTSEEGYVPNWDDAKLVYESEEYPQTKTIGEPLDTGLYIHGTPAEEEEPVEEESEVTCSCCGRKIPKGKQIYFVPGYIYECCSAECLLDAMVPMWRSKTCTGHYDD